MIAKKTKRADLEKKRFAFFQIGLIVVGSVTLAAFEYSTVQEHEQVVRFNDQGPAILTEPDLTDFNEPEKPEPTQQVSVRQEIVDSVQITTATLPDPAITTKKIVITDEGKDNKGTKFYGFLIPEDETIFDVVSKEPEFPGGAAAMKQFIVDNTVFPEMAREMGEGGTVYVEFVVNSDGSISDVVSKSPINRDLEREAIRVVKSMPKWIPGEQAGKKVRVRYTIPIHFTVMK